MAERRLARCGESPSVLCSTTGLPTLVDSTAPCLSDPAPLPDGPEKGRPVPGGKDRPRAKHGEGRDRRAPSTRKAVRLREANWYPTRNVGASEAIQISANCAECVCPWIDHIRDEKLPASSQRERDVADVDRDRHRFGCGAPIEKRHCQRSRDGSPTIHHASVAWFVLSSSDRLYGATDSSVDRSIGLSAQSNSRQRHLLSDGSRAGRNNSDGSSHRDNISQCLRATTKLKMEA